MQNSFLVIHFDTTEYSDTHTRQLEKLLLQTNMQSGLFLYIYLGKCFICISGCFACARAQIPQSLSMDLRSGPTGQKIRDYLNTGS